MEDFEERGWEQSTTEHEGNEASQLFHKQGLENTKKAISNAFVDAQSERDSTTVFRKAQTEPLEQVLTLLKKGVHDPDKQASEDTGADDNESGRGSLPNVTAEAVSDEDSEEEDISFALRLARASGKKVAPKPAAKPKPASKPITQRAPVAAKGVPKLQSAPALGHGEGMEKTDSTAAPEDVSKTTFLLDGRGNRTKETLNKHLKDFTQRCLAG